MQDYDGDGHQNGGYGHGGDAGGQEESGSAVFVSNLQWWTTDAELEQLCAPYGRVTSLRFIDDKACGKSRGMAIVDFAEPDAATQCIAGLNGRDINGRPCRVNYQQQRNQAGGSGREQYGGGRGMGSGMGGGGGGRGRGGRGGRGGGRSDDMGGGGGGDMMAGAGGMVFPGVMMPGMMGMGMDMGAMQQQMLQAQMMMPQMMGFAGMPGMPGFKPPPPPGGPPKNE